jgi:hypothetical protein
LATLWPTKEKTTTLLVRGLPEMGRLSFEYGFQTIFCLAAGDTSEIMA